MIRRHPHVFGGEDGDARVSAPAQTRAWEAQKADERQARAVAEGRTPSALDGVALALPPCCAPRSCRSARPVWASTGRHPPPVFDKVVEEVDELRDAASSQASGSSDMAGTAVAEELGDLLFACVNLARHLGVDAEAALRGANAKFTARFHHVEAALAESGRSAEEVGPAELDRLWEDAKRSERRPSGDAAAADPAKGER